MRVEGELCTPTADARLLNFRFAEPVDDIFHVADSVKSVAYSLGFASPSAFCAAFRRETGETPGTYRVRVCIRQI